MTRLISNNKALTVNPLKVSQSMGASLAFFGIDRCMPLEHGAQGCTAFSRVFFTRHFREPIPLQTTAMNHAVTVMGANDNVVEALKTLCERHQPELIGLASTGLTETQGADLSLSLQQFRRDYPQYANTAVVPVSTPDTSGCLESGFAAALTAIIDVLVKPGRRAGNRPRQVNVLLSSALTPGDVETIAEWIRAFDLSPVMLPDLADSLDGHIDQLGYSSLTTGGSDCARIAAMGESVATLVIGRSLHKAAALLKARTGVPDFHFAGLMGVDACDEFTACLQEIGARLAPGHIRRQRGQLLDAMVDCQLQLGGVRAAVAADPEHLGVMVGFLQELGIGISTAVSSARSDSLQSLPLEEVLIGDLEDLETAARQQRPDLLIANSHGAEIARQLGIPHLRAGFPLYDQFGGFARSWVGYKGSQQVLFDIANLVSWQRQDIPVYRSIYWQEGPRMSEQVHYLHSTFKH